MKITSTQFVKGIIGTDPLLYQDRKYLAFLGRSNVGKSSLINSLVGQKNMARSSSKPGMTKQINLFLINKSFYLVDLPGYGYAKTDNKMRLKIIKMIDWFLFASEMKRVTLVLIVDSKIGPTEHDLHTMEAVREAGIDTVVVANKIDKVPVTKQAGAIAKIAKEMDVPKVYKFSSKTGAGKGELIHRIIG